MRDRKPGGVFRLRGRPVVLRPGKAVLTPRQVKWMAADAGDDGGPGDPVEQEKA